MTKFGTRYYDPAVGRWAQLDPSGVDAHYVYAKNNPVNFVDPTGYWYVDFSASAGIGGGCYINSDGYRSTGGGCYQSIGSLGVGASASVSTGSRSANQACVSAKAIVVAGGGVSYCPDSGWSFSFGVGFDIGIDINI